MAPAAGDGLLETAHATGGYRCLLAGLIGLCTQGVKAYCPTPSASGLTLVPRRPSGGTPCSGAAAAQPARARQPPAVGPDDCPGGGPALHMAVTAGSSRWRCEAPGSQVLLPGMMHQWHGMSPAMQPNVLPLLHVPCLWLHVAAPTWHTHARSHVAAAAAHR